MPVWKTRPAGRLSSVEAFARLRTAGLLEWNTPWSFLLDSAAGTEQTGRYSFLGCRPYLVFSSRRDQITIQSAEGTRTFRDHPLRVLRDLLAEQAVSPVLPAWGLPPFIGGAVGYFGYGLAQVLERPPASAPPKPPKPDDLGLPDCVLLFVDTVVAFDHHAGSITIVATPRADLFRREGPDKSYARAREQIALIEERLNHPSSHPSPSRGEGEKAPSPPRSTHTRETYCAMVKAAKEYIAAGDIYQANLSQRFTVDIGDRDPWDLYQALRRINPSPFAAYLECDDFCLVSSSPERLVRLAGQKVETRPIAGTRPRGSTPPADAARQRELTTNAKERAEHLMLVDLERNDLGRVCDYGSVWVDELMAVETYSHVLHIVSNIRGVLRADRDAFDLLAAVFPGGTITGVPKIRCMEIIDELEPVARGPYSGAIGYVSVTGDLDLNLIIRTFIVTGQTAHIQVGAGIVADSDPDREYDETLHKAEALLAALKA